MNTEQRLLDKWRTLPPPKQQEVLDFIDSLSAQFTQTQWKYLEKRPHPWRKQLYLKGRRLKAFDLWANMMANEMTPEEVADNWDVPLEAVRESIEYCETHQDLLKQEAEIERRHLEERGITLEPKITPR
ncbi:hypothetical protein PCC8801_0842 [Rippkaea orientalis PCC 8801]|uniref:DUF433 domain-containing protein n=1 Tax=Rippkaea orientalis (strain PCC 8801 / RF-1) TaxID=41431 RepID=B7JYQ2_RIPO1|nr:hypothetical protein [Rippkaea orientalis]ACK64922.1 hypothetical protein PCC8801_0842 [Rippkaea orientalis PCC 8801]